MKKKFGISNGRKKYKNGTNNKFFEEVFCHLLFRCFSTLLLRENNKFVLHTMCGGL